MNIFERAVQPRGTQGTAAMVADALSEQVLTDVRDLVDAARAVDAVLLNETEPWQDPAVDALREVLNRPAFREQA